MEKFAYFCICFVAIMALVMIVLVIIAVLKVASERDDEHDLTERIKFQAKEGLIDRDGRQDDGLRDGRRSEEPERVGAAVRQESVNDMVQNTRHEDDAQGGTDDRGH